MGMQIADGRSGKTAEVNDQNQLVTRAIAEPELEHASAEGNAWTWDSTELDLVAGETFLFVKNTDTRVLVLDRLVVNGSNVICTWDINLGNATDTPAGTTVPGVNTNTVFLSKTANVIAMSDETAVADGSTIDRIKTAVSGHHVHDLTGVILGEGTYIQINQETESTSGSVILHAHFEIPS